MVLVCHSILHVLGLITFRYGPTVIISSFSPTYNDYVLFKVYGGFIYATYQAKADQ